MRFCLQLRSFDILINEVFLVLFIVLYGLLQSLIMTFYRFDFWAAAAAAIA